MFSKKELAIVSNLRFASMKIFMSSGVKHERSFITSGPGCLCLKLESHYKICNQISRRSDCCSCHMGHAKRKWVFKHAQNMRIHIMRMPLIQAFALP